MKRKISESDKATDAKEKEEKTQQMGFLKQLSALSGITDKNQLLSMTQLEIQNAIVTKQKKDGFDEEYAQSMAESAIGTEKLSLQTGLDSKKLEAITLKDIQAKTKTPEELGVESEARRILTESRTVMSYYNHQAEETSDPQIKEDLGKLASDAAKLQARIETNRHKKEDVYELEYKAKYGIMNAQSAQKVNRVLTDAGYAEQQRQLIQDTWFQTGMDVYVQARMNGESEEATRKAAREAQARYLEGVHSELPDEYKDEFEEATAGSLSGMEVRALAVEKATETGDMQIVYDAQDALTIDQQKDVVRDYGLMTDFAANSLFDSVSNIFGVAGDVEEFSSQGVVINDFLQSMDAEQLRIDEQLQRMDIDAMMEDVTDAIEEGGGEKDIDELDDEREDQLKEKLEDFGFDMKTTLKEAKEMLQKVQDDLKRVGELRSRKQDNPPAFYSEKTAKEIINQNNFKPTEMALELVAVKFLKTSFTALNYKAEEVAETYDSNVVAAQEENVQVVSAYLQDPTDKEKEEQFKKAVEDPKNVALIAALLEATARTAAKYKPPKQTNAE